MPSGPGGTGALRSRLRARVIATAGRSRSSVPPVSPRPCAGPSHAQGQGLVDVFSSRHRVLAYDISPRRVALLQQHYAGNPRVTIQQHTGGSREATTVHDSAWPSRTQQLPARMCSVCSAPCPKPAGECRGCCFHAPSAGVSPRCPTGTIVAPKPACAL